MRIMAASRCAFIKSSFLRDTPLTVDILTFSIAFQPRPALAPACFRKIVGVLLRVRPRKGQG